MVRQAAMLVWIAAGVFGCTGRGGSTVPDPAGAAEVPAPTLAPMPAPAREAPAVLVVVEGAPRTLLDGCLDVAEPEGAACLKLGRVVSHASGPLPSTGSDAAKWFERACKLGVPEGCGRDALLATTPARALDLWLTACDHGLAEACEGLGWAEITGAVPARGRADGEAHMRRAAALYEQACVAGSELDCAKLGVLLDDGLGVPRDAARAAALFEKACGAGDPLGCERVAASSGSVAATDGACGAGRANCSPVGLRSEVGRGLPFDPSRGAALYKRGCDLGEWRACANLGFAHEAGIGVDQDFRTAEYYYRFACDKDDVLGCFGFGRMHHQGTAAEPDLRVAAAYLGEVCEATGELGCREVFDLYERGLARRSTVTRAIEKIKARCAADDALACMEVGGLLTTSQLVAFDGRGALAAWQRACGLGHGPGCLAAGKALVDGDLVPQDKEAGRAWLARGCQAGDDASCRLERLHFGPIGGKPRP